MPVMDLLGRGHREGETALTPREGGSASSFGKDEQRDPETRGPGHADLPDRNGWLFPLPLGWRVQEAPVLPGLLAGSPSCSRFS